MGLPISNESKVNGANHSDASDTDKKGGLDDALFKDSTLRPSIYLDKVAGEFS
jgi:hypothetical protein